MSPVWRPAIDPPCLDKFCHLSHDAQRVMVAIFEDFNIRKRELLQSRTRQENTLQDASDYYRAKYEARFGPMYRAQPQPSTRPSVNEQRHTHGPVSRDSTTTNGHYASVDNLYQARDQNLQYNSNSDRILDSMWGEDTSTYSDSPPIETQGYRFLSQLTRNEANLDQNNECLSIDNSIQTEENTLSNFGIQPNLNSVSASRSSTGIGYEPSCEPEKGFKQNNSNILHMGNRTLETEYETPKGSFNDIADDSTGIASFNLETDLDIPDSTRSSGTYMYTAEKFVGETENPEVTVAETSSYSQSLFSQDSLTGQIITPNKKRLPKTKACVMKRKSFEKPELNSNTYGDGQHSGHSSCLSGSGRENIEEMLNIAKPQAVNRRYDTSDSDKMDRMKQTGALFKDKDSVSMDICSLQLGTNGESYAVSSNLTDLNTEKASHIHPPTFQTKRLEKNVESMRLDEESPFLHSDLKLKHSDTHTPVRNRPEVICDESPFHPNNAAGRDVYDIFKISSKKDSGSLTKRPLQPGTESIHGSTQKRQSASKGFAVPIKKVKTNITECKKRGVSKKNLDKLRGVVCSSRSIPREVFLFPFVPTGDTFYQTSRSFMLELLQGETRKVGMHVQRTFLEILKYVGGDTSKVDSRWTILDPIVAMWLLDPDHPVNNFEEILTKVGMPPMAPSSCCQDMIYEDMMLLGVAMERLYKQLQAKELWDLFICVEMKLTPLLAMLEMTPLSVATHTLMQFSEILKKKCTKLEKEAHEAAGHAFLLTSPSQLRQVLFEELQLDTKLPSKSRLARTSVGRETSTSESVLTQLSPFHPLPGIILEYRQVQKLKSTYIDGILSCVENDHLRTNWDQTAAATGRLTAYQPNVQAIPKIPVTITRYKENYIAGRESEESIDIYARDAFVSQPGWTLLAADFQQIELRLLAQLAVDPILLKLFNDKEIPDIFNALTAQWLGKSIEAISTVEREQSKRVVYSIMYGVGKEKLAEHLKMSVDQAKAIMASFLVKFPAVKQFTQTCVEFCQKNGYCCSIFKRRRLIPNIRHSSPVLRAQAERQAVNFCIQGSAADICKAAMIQIVHALSVREDVSARLLMQIHDELLLEVLDSDLEHVTALVKDVMESSDKLCGSVIKLKVPLPVSLSTGKTWGHMTAVESKQNMETL